ncbi:hypothetical protein QTP88_018350 [Uroleucon formosanum]
MHARRDYGFRLHSFLGLPSPSIAPSRSSRDPLRTVVPLVPYTLPLHHPSHHTTATQRNSFMYTDHDKSDTETHSWPWACCGQKTVGEVGGFEQTSKYRFRRTFRSPSIYLITQQQQHVGCDICAADSIIVRDIEDMTKIVLPLDLPKFSGVNVVAN